MPRKTVKTTKKTLKATKTTKKSVKKPTKRAPKSTSVTTPQTTYPTAPTTPVVSVVTAPVTESQKIWEEIRYRPIEMFALPNQIVEQHCTPYPVDPIKLYLTVRSTATLPSLEASCGKDFVVELADKFVIVSRAPVPFVLPKK